MRFGLMLAVGLGLGMVPRQMPDAGQRELSREVLQELIETDTTHSTGSTTVAAMEIRDRMLKAGFEPGDIAIVGPKPGRMNLVVRYRAELGEADESMQPKAVVVMGHLDVVEARRDEWTMEPFKLVERDGYFYGRGTQDMKDAVAAFVTSFIELKEQGYVPKRDVILMLTADEEGGADNGTKWLLRYRRDLIDAEYAINPDAGGLLLSGGRPVEMDLEATEKLYADFEFTATNPGGHSSRPVPDNAIYAVADALGKLERNPFPVELNSVTRAYLEAQEKKVSAERRKLIEGVLARPMNQQAASLLAADPGYNAMMRTTCVATMMQAGHAVNALPGSAGANVNCRIIPGHSLEEVRKRLIAIVNDKRVKVQFKDEAGRLFEEAPDRVTLVPPPLRPDVLRMLRGVTASMWPGVPVVPEMASGASDSIFMTAAGIPGYGFSGLGIDEGDSRAHGRDERILEESYYAGVEFSKRLVMAVGDD